MSQRSRTSQDIGYSGVLQLKQFNAIGTPATPFRFTDTPVITYNASYVERETNRSMTDVVTPRFRERVAKGEIINTPMESHTITTFDSSAPYYRSWVQMALLWSAQYGDVWCANAGYRLVGTVPLSTQGKTRWAGTLLEETPEVDVQRCIDIAVANVWNKVQVSETAALVTLAEGNKTIASCVDIMKRLVRIGKAIRRLDGRRIAREFSAKQLADRWMEARYAIRPMIYDMKSTLKAFNTRSSKVRLRQTFRSGYSDHGIATQSGVLGAEEAGIGFTTVNKLIQRSVLARTGVLAAVDAISDASIWGLDQPFEALWELVPFSFVVDWFVNVSKTIAAWTPNAGIQALASWCVVDDTTVATNTIVSTTKTYACPPEDLTYECKFEIGPGSIWRAESTRTRIVNPNRFVSPSINIRLDAAKLLDLAIMGKKIFS